MNRRLRPGKAENRPVRVKADRAVSCNPKAPGIAGGYFYYISMLTGLLWMNLPKKNVEQSTKIKNVLTNKRHCYIIRIITDIE